MPDSKIKKNLEQYARFLEIARALSCDEDEAAFDEKLKGIVKPSSVKLLKPTEDS